MVHGAAAANKVALICHGDITIYDHGTVKLNDTGSVLDLDNQTFTAPAYGTFPITRMEEASISFGSETPTNSTSGDLDRISGALTMMLMPPVEREKLKAGKPFHLTAYVDAKCLPSKKMF